MSSTSALGFMDIIVLACGAYLLYGYYLLTVKNEIKQGILIPKTVDPKKCKDLEGYKKYMGFRLLILSAASLISGGLGLYQDYVGKVNQYLYLVFYVLFFAALIWFIVSVKKAEKQYW